ncbi:MAG: D-alanyl-D-alanine carboxypeptidase family protein [Erysipelotrichaceae bacterium]
MKKIGIVLICFLLSCVAFIQPLKAETALTIDSKHGILIDLNDNRVLYEKNADEKTYPASITKIMSALVALEQIKNINQKVVMNDQMFAGLLEADASQAGFKIGETLSLKDLLYGSLLASGGEATNALAISAAGSIPAFVDLMNQKAKQLGMSQTHFTNPIGLHDDQHYTTCNDLVKLLKAAIKNKDLYTAFCSKSYHTTPTSKNINGLTFKSTLARQIASLNYRADYIKGGKTGFTPEAGMCLASISEKDGTKYLAITTENGHDNLKPYNVIDAVHMYEYFFNHYERAVLVRKGEELTRVKVLWNFGTKEFVYNCEKDIDALLEKGIRKEDIKLEYIGNKEVKTPVKKGALLGNVEIKANDKLVKSVEILALDSVDKNPILYYCDRIGDFFHEYRGVTLAALTIMIASFIGVLWYKKNKKYLK